jgi:hypothetical protein
MTCHTSTRCEAAFLCFGGGKAAEDDHRRVYGPPDASKAAPEETARWLKLWKAQAMIQEGIKSGD